MRLDKVFVIEKQPREKTRDYFKGTAQTTQESSSILSIDSHFECKQVVSLGIPGS